MSALKAPTSVSTTASTLMAPILAHAMLATFYLVMDSAAQVSNVCCFFFWTCDDTDFLH